ncbi:hypothetical protein F5B21DRAFT_477933 [Xylaria acuta]|nr:hypothetical protein F5B21DRAFT_477933 [Xylaria acuta]
MNAIFDDSCRWPRRLLHVPTMTSHRWALGDRYGEHESPRYVVLSYTWGRWRLGDDEAPEVPMLPVNGIDWSIPRVSPEAFKTGEMAAVLRCICDLASELAPVEHVWLDVACIDQRVNSPEMAAEIGRQARIFKGAYRAFIWLFKHDSAAVDSMHHSITEQEGSWPFEYDRDLGVSLITKDYVDFLLSDPWFSSLWTLQEAHLRPDAIPLTREGQVWAFDGIRGDGEVSMPLGSILTRIQATYDTVAAGVDGLASQGDRLQYDKLVVALEDSGLLAMNFHCPTSLLAVSAFRQVSRREDRVYGIMQVFDLRVGKSRPGADVERDFSLEELEDELGAELNATDPMLGQMHVYASRPIPGKGWRIGPESRPATSILLSYNSRTSKATTVPLARMSTTILKDTGTTWGVFTGVQVPLARLHKVWLAMANGHRWPQYFQPFTIAVDCVQDYDGLSVTSQRQNDYWDIVHKVAKAHSDAVVLLLGHHIDIPKAPRFPVDTIPVEDDAFIAAVGLIVVPYASGDYIQGPVCRRIAVCSWKLHPEHSMLPFTHDLKSLLEGKGDHWAPSRIVFG